MTRLTENRCVRSGQREFRGCVVEGGRRPGRRRMALIARLREISRNVIGICRTLEIRLMALETACISKLIISIDVTVHALNSRVRAGKRELCRCVVKCRRGPAVHAVARQAVR